MIDNTNRMEVSREAIKHIYIARLMMRMVCHSTDCGGCLFHNANLRGGRSCFYAQLQDVEAEFPKLEDMLLELNNQPKHSKPINEDGNETSR